MPAPNCSSRNIAGLLWEAADAAGKRTAVVDSGHAVSYRALRAGAAAVAAALSAAGVGPDEPVAILLGRSAEAAAAVFGVLACGAIAVVIHEASRPRQIEYALAHAGARRLVTAADVLQRLPRALDPAPQVIDVRRVMAVRAQRPAPPVQRAAQDAAQIVFTSGSTGLPKGVVLSHGNLQAGVWSVTSYLELQPEDRIASVLPFGFVYGMSQLLCGVSVRATLVIERSPLPVDIAQALRGRRVTVLPTVPPQWARLLETREFRGARLPDLRIMTNAGGHLPQGAVRALRQAQPQARLFLMYGLTEALRTTYLPPEEVDRHPDSIGRPAPGVAVHVLRDDGTPAAAGELGELVHRGPTVALGYWRNPEQTARVFRPPPPCFEPPPTSAAERVVFTGDLVRRDAQGLLYFVGRRDRIIKTLGYRVGPDEVADVLYASGQVTDVAVLGVPDELWGQRIVAHVVLARGGSLSRLRAFAASELPRYMQPARFEIRRDLPRLSNGKHDVHRLARAASRA